MEILVLALVVAVAAAMSAVWNSPRLWRRLQIVCRLLAVLLLLAFLFGAAAFSVLVRGP